MTVTVERSLVWALSIQEQVIAYFSQLRLGLGWAEPTCTNSELDEDVGSAWISNPYLQQVRPVQPACLAVGKFEEKISEHLLGLQSFTHPSIIIYIEPRHRQWPNRTMVGL